MIRGLDGNVGQTLGELASIPSIIYSPFVTALTGGYDINREPLANISGVAHITGGGQPSKIGRLLSQTDGLGAVIDNPNPAPKIMQWTQQLRNFDDITAYEKWNMGTGMMITTSEPNKVLKEARNFGIEARQIGEITNSGKIVISSSGAETPCKTLEFKIA